MSDCLFCGSEDADMKITVVGTGSALVCSYCMEHVLPACRSWQVNKALTDGVATMPKIKFEKAP